jgi:hypothetical protein
VVGHAVLANGPHLQDQEFASRKVGKLEQVPDKDNPLADKVVTGPEHCPPGVQVLPRPKVRLHLERTIWVESEGEGLGPVHQPSRAVARLHSEPVADWVTGSLINKQQVSLGIKREQISVRGHL